MKGSERLNMCAFSLHPLYGHVIVCLCATERLVSSWCVVLCVYHEVSVSSLCAKQAVHVTATG